MFNDFKWVFEITIYFFQKMYLELSPIPDVEEGYNLVVPLPIQRQWQTSSNSYISWQLTCTCCTIFLSSFCHVLEVQQRSNLCVKRQHLENIHKRHLFKTGLSSAIFAMKEKRSASMFSIMFNTKMRSEMNIEHFVLSTSQIYPCQFTN